ncbi:MAG TPA: DUF1801 domain-containing protein [Chryseosolibacter sp.]
MAEPKTRMTEASVGRFIESFDDERKRDDCFAIIEMMKKASGAEAKMWGTAIVGFGTQKQVYANGKKLDWPVIAFSPRKQNISLYLSPQLLKSSPLLDKLGKHKTSKGCLYIKSLDDVDRGILQKIVDASVKG